VKILEEVDSEKNEAGEGKVREKFVCPSNFGQKTKFVYIKLGETVALNIRLEYI